MNKTMYRFCKWIHCYSDSAILFIYRFPVAGRITLQRHSMYSIVSEVRLLGCVMQQVLFVSFSSQVLQVWGKRT